MENSKNHETGEITGACKGKETPVQPTSGNRFSKMKLLGSGTFGEVWKGFDGKLKCWVAIKTFQEVSSDNLGINMMVIREISLLRKLNHPNIMRMLDVLIGEKFDSKGLLIVMVRKVFFERLFRIF
jgi:mitogen-activated protein kinase 1/3